MATVAPDPIPILRTRKRPRVGPPALNWDLAMEEGGEEPEGGAPSELLTGPANRFERNSVAAAPPARKRGCSAVPRSLQRELANDYLAPRPSDVFGERREDPLQEPL